MGRVAAPYSVRGWVKVQPYTEYLDSLLDYPVWHLSRDDGWQTYRVLEGRPQGHYLVASLEGVEDRDMAQGLRGMEIAVPRAELPAADEDEYYWNDLVGLEVVNAEGVGLGRVSGLLETGSHDVLRVEAERERLIPFADPIVLRVDLEAGRIVVDWQPDY